MNEYLQLEQREHKDRIYNSFGVIMVKPHALEVGFDIIISDLLSNVGNPLYDKMNISEETRNCLSKLVICKTKIINFKKDINLFNKFLNTSYKDQINTNHYEILKMLYFSRWMFYIVAHEGTQEELDRSLKEFKGQRELLNQRKQIISNPIGVRGIFLDTGIIYETISDFEKEIIYKKTVNNLIHTSDNIYEAKFLINILLDSNEISEMEKYEILRIRNF
jgi:hypothetical protein